MLPIKFLTDLLAEHDDASFDAQTIRVELQVDPQTADDSHGANPSLPENEWDMHIYILYFMLIIAYNI